MKISRFLLGIICCMFFISIQDIYSTKRRHEQKALPSRNAKYQKTTKKTVIPSPKEDSDEGSEESFDNINEYIKSRPGRLKMLFFKAEMYFKTDEFETALPIYEKIVAEFNDPLAFFRLGEIYEEKSEKDPKLLTKCYDCYKLAFEGGVMQALEKLLEIGEALNKFVKEAQSKPMSVEIQQMYI